ncbi:hypothetical protein SAMN06265222_102353 [Neorhodopirellula lusitana]|uniref:AAA+ ATPase domain-containing protein n=1 Tax=Neorhodopirellula lusitana TaxID=445327 RepID=A0ABY1PVY6_9BACT|nr:ATP-binding protein [Neorhodopirellula lusitana]SMP47875.1 hypothetical protein SAMN06265222_102353 [Neorhodopirellula lusitana]
MPLAQPSNPFASRFVRPGQLLYRRRDSRDQAGNVVSCHQNWCASLIERLRQSGCGVIVGAHGTGKSTLLQSLAPDLTTSMPGGQWVQLHRAIEANQASRTKLTGQPIRNRLFSGIARLTELRENVQVTLRTQSSVAAGGVLVIDGGEQLPAWTRWLIRRRASTRRHFCLITSHRPLSGFEPLHETTLDPSVVQSLVSELLQTSTHEPLNECIRQHMQKVDFREIDNVRDLWSDLYDLAEHHLSVTALNSNPR